jgi:F-type H+-transporting ATPase subunit g
MAVLRLKQAQLQGKICKVMRFAGKHECAYQKSLIEKNKQYVV